MVSVFIKWILSLTASESSSFISQLCDCVVAALVGFIQI